MPLSTSETLLNVGLVPNRTPWQGAYPGCNMFAVGDEAYSYNTLASFGASGWGPTFETMYARGTPDAPEIPQIGDLIGFFQHNTFGGGEDPDVEISPVQWIAKIEDIVDDEAGKHFLVEYELYLNDGVSPPTIKATFSAKRRVFAINAAIKSDPCTVAQLPAFEAGMRAYVTDATSDLWGNEVEGGGSIETPVFAKSTGWFVG